MKRLLNTLYITTGNKYLSLDGENVVILEDQKEFLCITYRQLLHLDILERVRRLWERV